VRITVGLYYNGARYLAAWLGRWTSADPIGLQAGLNLYQYCRGSPINYTDPTGTLDEPLGGAPPVDDPREGTSGYGAASQLDTETMTDEEALEHVGSLRESYYLDGQFKADLELAGEKTVDIVGGGFAYLIGGIFGADTSSSDSADARRAAWAAYDENSGPAEVDAASLPTRMNQDVEASLHVAAFMAPGVLLKHIGRGLTAMATAEARILGRSAPGASTAAGEEAGALAGSSRGLPARAEGNVPFDKAKLAKIQANLEREGADFVYDDALLEAEGARGLYLPGPGGRPGTIVLGSNPSRTTVIEELFHLGQHRATGFSPEFAATRESARAVEMEAQIGIANIKTVQWTTAEIMHYIRAWNYWRTW